MVVAMPLDWLELSGFTVSFTVSYLYIWPASLIHVICLACWTLKFSTCELHPEQLICITFPGKFLHLLNRCFLKPSQKDVKKDICYMCLIFQEI